MARLASIPALHLSTWFDTSLPSTIGLWQALQAHARSQGLPFDAPLVIGPWTHGNRHQPFAGDLDFGAAVSQANFFITHPQSRPRGKLLHLPGGKKRDVHSNNGE